MMAPAAWLVPVPTPWGSMMTSSMASRTERSWVVPNADMAGNEANGRKLGHPPPATALFALNPSTR